MDYYKPQLARDFKYEKDADKFGNPRYALEKKLDGWRLRVEKDKVWTGRQGKNRVIPFLVDIVGEGTRLDGEIVDIEEKMQATDVAHLISHEEEHHKLKFKVFDIEYLNGESVIKKPWKERRKILEDYYNEHLSSNSQVELSELLENTQPLRKNGVGFTNDILERVWKEGWEGAMIKDKMAPLAPGSRANYVKWKKTYPVDVVIVDAEGYPSEWTVRPGEKGSDGVLYPEGKHSEPWDLGYRGLRYGFHDSKTGNLKVVGSLGYTEMPEKLEEFIGLVAEVKCYGQYPDTAALKHPIWLSFRDASDKDAKDVIFDFEKGVIA